MGPEIGWEQELQARVRSIFVEEAAERLAALDAAVAALQASLPDSEAAHHLWEAFRHAHTLKGGARAAGLPGVEQMAAGLEQAFERLRDRGRAGPGTWEAIAAEIAAVKALIGGRAD